MRNQQIEVPCEVCRTPMKRAPWQIRRSQAKYCSRHCYWSALRSKPDEERFWSKVDKDGPVHPVLGTACWIWTGAKTVAGYGYLQTSKHEKRLAHRVSWSMHHGAEPADKAVCHTCDNPPCVRPDHLFLGTDADNVRDCVKKGRDGSRILTVEDVLAIRAEYSPRRRGRGTMAPNQYNLAEKYGVTQTTIGCIIRRETWRHV